MCSLPHEHMHKHTRPSPPPTLPPFLTSTHTRTHVHTLTQWQWLTISVCALISLYSSRQHVDGPKKFKKIKKTAEDFCRGRTMQTVCVGCVGWWEKSKSLSVVDFYYHLTWTWDDSGRGKRFSLAMGMCGGGREEMGRTPTWASCLQRWRSKVEPLVNPSVGVRKLEKTLAILLTVWGRPPTQKGYFERRWC